MLWVIGLIWVVGAAAGVIYANLEHIPLSVAFAVMPAFLLEVTGYIPLMTERLRKKLERFSPLTIAWALTVASVVPYTIAALATGTFDWRAFVWIGLLAAASSFWYILLPHKVSSDILFLVFVAVVWLSRTLRVQYVSTYPKLQLEVLGHLMWVRTGAYSMLSVRRMDGVGFGFWPEPREWKIGTAWFVVFAIAAVPLAWWLGFSRPRMPALLSGAGGWERLPVLIVVTFFGSLWVLALSEEFLFRGLLQQWISKWLKSELGGLLAASSVFGLVHLWMRPFPNWRNAVMAGILGVFCGIAFRQARSIRAPMVTHALTITIWRIFFTNSV